LPHAMALQTDTVAMLSKTWVSRGQLHGHKGEPEPAHPHEEIELTFRQNGTYTLIRHYGVAEAGSVEEGRWKYKAPDRYISMQTRQVDGGAMLSTMLPRWEIIEVTDTKLVLRFLAMSGQYLVLEAPK
jgi:hypothetical protein